MTPKMITRKDELTVALLFLSTLTLAHCQDARPYDNSNDWIPIHQPEHNIQKKATGRVLTIPEPSSLRFFPEEYRNTRQAEYQQQYLRETLNPTKQRSRQPPHLQRQPFTPQQLEQYYIDQRRKLNEQQRLQDQYELLPTKTYNNNVKTQSKLLTQTYDNLPTKFLPPPQNPQQLKPSHYIFPSNPDSVPLVQQLANVPTISTLSQFVQQPPGPNGTVEFYNNLNENFHSSNVRQNNPIELTTSRVQPVKEDVQLLYLPIEQLQAKQKDFQREEIQNVYPQQLNFEQQRPNENLNYNQKNTRNQQDTLLRNIQNDFIQQAFQAHKLQQQLEQEVPTPPTVVRKRKPHQPPLAVYMNGQENARATDVVKALKESKTINVQDTIGPDSPHVFVGPANLLPPNGFSKFELPYLSSIESNRVERKVDQLPFFVAPLNYKTPPGYEKIPFPPPHVGSVVVNINTLRSDESTAYNHFGGTVPSFNGHQKTEEAIPNPTKRPVRQRNRHPQRITTQFPIETTTHRTDIPIFNHQYHSGVLTSTSNPPNQKPIVPQTQFNQNKYFPGISLEQLREYQVDKTNYQPPIQSSVPGNGKQLYNYLEISTERPESYESHDSSPEKRKPKPVFELSPIGSTITPYDQKFRGNSVNQPNAYNQVVQVTPPTTTNQPKLEEFVRLVKVAEEMIIRPQSNDPPPRDIFGIAPQADKIQAPELPLISKQTKQYLPIHSQSVQNIPPAVNYDHLFEAPFVTNSEVNQINSAAKATAEKPDKKHVELKYVVLEEYPITQNASTTTKPEVLEEINKFEDTPGVEPNTNKKILIIKPQGANINDLVDPNIRQLLTPALLVPPEKPKEKHLDTETPTIAPKKVHIITTHEPIEYKGEVTSTTSTKPEVARIRNRGRGGARYNDRTTTYSPRRNSARVRTRTRLTTTTEQDRESYTTTPSSRIVSTRQRLRSRGRPMISQGYSSTISNVQHATEPTTASVDLVRDEDDVNREEVNKFGISPFTEEAVLKPQLITRAKSLSPEEEYLVTKYNLPLAAAQDDKSEVYDVQAESDKDADALEDVIRFSTPKKADESTTIYTPIMEYAIRSIHRSTEKPKIKQRIRGKSRLPTGRTTTPPTTTEPPNLDDASSSVEEFYGFFRQPNFKSTTKEDYSSTPRVVLGLKESSTERNVDDDGADERIQVISNNREGTNKPIQFIGEILPKYSTTEKYFEITPELTPISDMYVMTTPTSVATTKRRSRGRYSTRKPVEKTEKIEDSNEDGPNTVDDRSTQRQGTRGRIHFKLPVVVTTDIGSDIDNYPALYLKAQKEQEDYTPQTSPQAEGFKITVEPSYEEESDQEPHASIVSHKYSIPLNQVQSKTNPKELKYVGGKHVHLNSSNFRANLTTVKMVEVELVTDPTENVDKEKRKGYWKLIKKKNPEEFEEAESQNIGIIRDNNFEPVVNKHKVTTEENSDENEDITRTAAAVEEEDLTSTSPPMSAQDETVKKRYHTKATTDDDDILTNKETDLEITSTNPKILMDGIRTSTSTSTEISRDAEICSKGICVKSDDFDEDK